MVYRKINTSVSTTRRRRDDVRSVPVGAAQPLDRHAQRSQGDQKRGGGQPNQQRWRSVLLIVVAGIRDARSQHGTGDQRQQPRD